MKSSLDLEQRGRVKTALHLIEEALDEIDQHIPDSVPPFSDQVQQHIANFHERMQLEDD